MRVTGAPPRRPQPQTPTEHVEQARKPWQHHPDDPRNGSTRAWRRLRATILTRDQHLCYLCGQPDADTVDHLVPVYRGGTDDPSNLAAVHDRNPPHCHRAKTQAEATDALNHSRGQARHPQERHPGLLG